MKFNFVSLAILTQITIPILHGQIHVCVLLTHRDGMFATFGYR